MNARELEESDSNLSQIGMDRGGQSIQKCREKFRDLLHLMIKIASKQSAFVTLDQVIKVTSRRVNALEHVVIPKFLNIQKYIIQELDELSREDMYRIKKVLENKRKQMMEEAQQKIKEAAYLAAQGLDLKAPGNILDQDNDEDMLF